jgi:hypothetical protein
LQRTTTSEATEIIVTDPGCVPERKGPIRDQRHLATFLRELMAARPQSHLIVARIAGAELYVDDGTQGKCSTAARPRRPRLKSFYSAGCRFKSCRDRQGPNGKTYK